jgi:hypothetical protein
VIRFITLEIHYRCSVQMSNYWKTCCPDQANGGICWNFGGKGRITEGLIKVYNNNLVSTWFHHYIFGQGRRASIADYSWTQQLLIWQDVTYLSKNWTILLVCKNWKEPNFLHRKSLLWNSTMLMKSIWQKR